MTTRPRVCVFCGASPRVDARFLSMAREVGENLARAGCDLIYGGASTGLMGALADGALAAGARVVGVIPTILRDREFAHASLTELHVVDTLAVRKARMISQASGFLALPGGFGTLDELFEVATLRQVGEHSRPIAVYDPVDFYAPLLTWIAHAAEQHFIPAHVRDVIEALPSLDALQTWTKSLHQW